MKIKIGSSTSLLRTLLGRAFPFPFHCSYFPFARYYCEPPLRYTRFCLFLFLLFRFITYLSPRLLSRLLLLGCLPQLQPMPLEYQLHPRLMTSNPTNETRHRLELRRVGKIEQRYPVFFVDLLTTPRVTSG